MRSDVKIGASATPGGSRAIEEEYVVEGERGRRGRGGCVTSAEYSTTIARRARERREGGGGRDGERGGVGEEDGGCRGECE